MVYAYSDRKLAVVVRPGAVYSIENNAGSQTIMLPVETV